ncbi:MAG: ABC transporter ATP-binding protein [Bacillota bacterium]
MMQLFTDFFTFTAIVIYMLWIDWRMTLLLLATFPFMILTTRLFGRRMRSLFRTVQESVADVSDHLQNTLTGIRLIKCLLPSPMSPNGFPNERGRTWMPISRWSACKPLMSLLLILLNYVGLAIVLVFGAWLAMKGQMTVGTIVAFIAYLRLL